MEKQLLYLNEYLTPLKRGIIFDSGEGNPKFHITTCMDEYGRTEPLYHVFTNLVYPPDVQWYDEWYYKAVPYTFNSRKLSCVWRKSSSIVLNKAYLNV